MRVNTKNYLEVNYNIPIKLIIKDSRILPYIKQVLTENFKFTIITEELDFKMNYTVLELSKDIDIETFKRHFCVISKDSLGMQIKDS